MPGKRMGGLWGWTYEGEDRPHAIACYEADLTTPDDPWLRLRYCVNGEQVDCMVRLVTTRPNYGGPPPRSFAAMRMTASWLGSSRINPNTRLRGTPRQMRAPS